MAGYYKDVREHLKVLEERDKLFRIKKQINKDTQLMPLVRLQFRGLEEKQREAFQFENVIDVKGRRYTMPVTVGTLAASTEIYALGLKCEVEQIHERWFEARDRSGTGSDENRSRGVQFRSCRHEFAARSAERAGEEQVNRIDAAD
ncbi:MAG: hypothetical protein ABWZ38_09425 [Candidatus Binatia bacterium]|jgi:UbiD family decarboxylase